MEKIMCTTIGTYDTININLALTYEKAVLFRAFSNNDNFGWTDLNLKFHSQFKSTLNLYLLFFCLYLFVSEGVCFFL